jgi:hypothetical protein
MPSGSRLPYLVTVQDAFTLGLTAEREAGESFRSVRRLSG